MLLQNRLKEQGEENVIRREASQALDLGIGREVPADVSEGKPSRGGKGPGGDDAPHTKYSVEERPEEGFTLVSGTPKPSRLIARLDDHQALPLPTFIGCSALARKGGPAVSTMQQPLAVVPPRRRRQAEGFSAPDPNPETGTPSPPVLYAL